MAGQNIILCVDDEKMVLECLQLWLEHEFKSDYLIEIAESGAEALEVIAEHSAEGNVVRAVICDYFMPGMNGDELIGRVNQLLPSAATILLTGQAQPEGMAKILDHLKIFSCLAKPWNTKELIRTVHLALASTETAH